MESVIIPRVNTSILSAVVNSGILGAFIQLGCKSLKEDQEKGILELSRKVDVFISFPMGTGKPLCYTSLLFILDNIWQYLNALQFCAPCELEASTECMLHDRN